MPPRFEEDTISSLERARARLYHEGDLSPQREEPSTLPHEIAHGWEDTKPLPAGDGSRHIRFAGIFFSIASIFFLTSIAVAGYFFYFGSNTVSVNKIELGIEGPSAIAGGDTVPLTLTIINRNPVTIQNATIEITFPEGTRSADDVLAPYQRYTEVIPTISSGETITRSIRAVVFGGAGQTLEFPVSLSYGTTGSSVEFVKKSSYVLELSSTPLSITIDTPSEVVSGKSFTARLTVRSNTTVPLENVVIATTFPFGFSLTSSSVPVENDTIVLGTIKPGTTREILISGVLVGQDKDERTLHAVVGTARSANDQTPSIVYMTQKATFSVAAPFIRTTLAIDGNAGAEPVLLPGSQQDVTLSYTNTLSANVSNATLEVALSGSGIDYNSVRTTRGFYRSSDHTVVFSGDADSFLKLLAPGASGASSFSFSTLPAGATISPTVTFTVTISGTRTGQTNVPEEVTSSTVKTAKVMTSVGVDVSSLRKTGPFANSGPFPPVANLASTFTIALRAETRGSAVADGIVKMILPEYVTYLDRTLGAGVFSYDSAAHLLMWKVGDLAQSEIAEGFFQISFTPSIVQKGTTPLLTGPVSFSGHDRFANVGVSASGSSATTATTRDPGYILGSANVQ